MTGSSRPEYAAVRHLLTSPAIEKRTAGYVGIDDFDWAGLERESASMSAGERILVRIASSLWSAEGTVGLWEVPRRLDRTNFRRVLEALELCRGESVRGTSPALDAA